MERPTGHETGKQEYFQNKDLGQEKNVSKFMVSAAGKSGEKR